MPHDMRRTPSQTSLPPGPPYYPRQSKTDQIVQNFYTKVAQIITQARLIQYDSLSSGNLPSNTNSTHLTLNPRQTSHHQKRPNKWFNLEMWDSDVYKEDLKYWRHTATSTDPMIIEFFLDTSELPKNKILVITDEKRRSKVDIHENEDGKTKNILLERWQLTLSHPSTDTPPELPVVYKKSIAFFRSLYSYVRLIPAFHLFKRIKANLNHDLKIGYRFLLPNTDNVDDIGIDVPIIEGETNVSSQFIFSPIDTPLGSLSLRVKYRKNCGFHIDESEEEMISANFMVEYDEQFFTPKYYQEQEQRKQKEERRKSTPPSGYSFLHSPQYNSLSDTPRSNSDLDTDLTFPRIHAPPNNTSSILPSRSSDSRRSLENPRSGRYDSNLSSSRPNVTLVQPFKSPSLSSSPSQDNLSSPTFSERSLPLHKSPSSLSLQQLQQRSPRPLSLSGGGGGSVGGGATLSSSLKSNSSAGSLTKFQPSFTTYRERNNGFSGRESVSSRKRSLTNRSDGSGASFNSSFFASLDPEDDVSEFVRLVDTREPLKMFSIGSTGPDDSEDNMSGSVYKSKQLQLSRFQKYKELHNTLSDSITSQSGPQQLESPQSGITLGTLSGSVSSSSTMSSISKSTTHPPNVPSRLSENVISDKQGEFIMPQHTRITSGGSLEKETKMDMMQTNNIIIRDYSSYPDELDVGMRHDQHSQQQHNQLHNPKSNVIDVDTLDKLAITDRDIITGSPASGNSVQDELLFNFEVSVDVSNVKFEEINNTLGTTTGNNQDTKMARIDEET